VFAAPKPDSAVPRAATATPARMRAFPRGRCLIVTIATATTARAPTVFATLAPHRTGQGNGNRNPDRKPDVNQRRSDYAFPTIKKERADAEQRRSEQCAEEVVDAERPRIPAGCGAPRERRRGRRVGEKRGRPGGQLRPPGRPPASRDGARETERDQGRTERKERFHQAEPKALTRQRRPERPGRLGRRSRAMHLLGGVRSGPSHRTDSSELGS